MDARLVEFLRERFGAEQRTSRNPLAGSCKPATEFGFQLLHADALEFLKREPRDWSDWKLVANLPYSVASPILVELGVRPSRAEKDRRHAATGSRASG